MSGIAQLFGGSSAKRDRADELTARSALHQNVFGYALPESQNLESSGSALSGQAGQYFGNLLRAGRPETEQAAAPAINANLSAADAQKRREALTGTGRTGGTAEQDRMRDAEVSSENADVINKTMQQNKAVGAEGLQQVGNDRMRQALAMLGLSEDAITKVLANSSDSRVDSQNIRNQTFSDVGKDVGNLIAGFL